jgi:predicted transcriptional regulator
MSKEPEITESFMVNEDSTDKLKEMWAFNLPCALLVNSSDYWSRIKPIYEEIYRDLQTSIKRSLAASLIEVGKIHLDQDFLLEVLRYFLLSDLAEVNQKIVPNLIDFI